MDYLHYYFGNYLRDNPEDLSYISRGKRVELIQRQVSLLKARNKAIQDMESTNEFGNLLDMFSGEAARSTMEEVYMGLSHSAPQIQGVEISSIANMSVENISKKIVADANNLSDIIIDFYNSLLSRLEGAYKLLNSSEAFDAFQERIIQEYCNNNHIPESNAAAQILQDFLSSEGLKSVKGSSALETYIQRLSLMAYSLASFEGGPVSYGTTRGGTGTASTLPEFFKIISQKTTGLWNNVIGRVGEMASAAGYEQVVAKAAKEFNKLDFEIDSLAGFDEVTGNSWLECSINKTGQLHLPEETTVFQTSTKDVNIRVTNGLVHADYGVTVKDYKMKKNAKYQTIRLGSSLSFLDAYNKVYGKNDLVYSLAAGHGTDSRANDSALLLSDASLDKYWNDLVAITVAGSVLDTLAGTPQENTVVLSVNGQLFSIEEVMEQVAQSVLGEDSAMSATGSLLGLKRSELLEDNRWYKPDWRNYASSKRRSADVLPGVVSTLNAARLNINLKILSTLLRM